jgi:hypothetical protein
MRYVPGPATSREVHVALPDKICLCQEFMLPALMMKTVKLMARELSLCPTWGWRLGNLGLSQRLPAQGTHLQDDMNVGRFHRATVHVKGLSCWLMAAQSSAQCSEA